MVQSVKLVYDPFEFVHGIEIFTITMVASFATWKMLNNLYEHMYEPTIEYFLPDEKCNQYQIRMGKYSVRVGFIYREFVKWLLIIMVLMIIHNLVLTKHRHYGS